MPVDRKTTVLDELIKAIRASAIYNPEVQVAPACILWPDRERQWEAIVPRLQERMPELCVLGDYDPERRQGPAIWLRCAIAGKCLSDTPEEFQQMVEEALSAYGSTSASSAPPTSRLPDPSPPIIYLPGVGRQDLRAVESCPEPLKPLAELQYRGVIWSQINAKDWTILAFLKSDQGGLGLDVAQDADTKRSMQLAVYHLLEEDLGLLRGKRLDKDFFNKLLTSGDPTRDLLTWVDQGEAYKASLDDTRWMAFVEVIRSQLGFNPAKEGQLAAAEKLAAHEGAWLPVWQRYLEAPQRYTAIPSLIERCPPPADLFADPSGWPQLNARKEEDLLKSLGKLEKLAPHHARKALRELDQEHGERRSWVWAELGRSPLAVALKHLADLSRACEQSLAVGTPEDMVAIYRTSAWEADDAALRSLEGLQDPQSIEAVQIALKSVYLPWLEDAARHLQQQVTEHGYPGGKLSGIQPRNPEPGTLILFVDGLRYDVGQRLLGNLERQGLSVELNHDWAALPSVTATAKPAVSPVATSIIGQDANADFEPSVKASGQSLKGGYHFHKLLKDAGWQVLSEGDLGDPDGAAWAEIGAIDKTGHASAWKLAQDLDRITESIADQVSRFLWRGWRRVEIITDHGFLALPGGLPSSKLANALSENTWGRCASLKPGAHSDEAHFSWFWNPSHSFALADGISCYGRKREYAHGGLSLQECLVPRIGITANAKARNTDKVVVTDHVWRGMRLTVAIEGSGEGLFLDVREHSGDKASTIAMSPKEFKDGKASVIVEDDERIEQEAYWVIYDADGSLLSQFETIIGGD